MKNSLFDKLKTNELKSLHLCRGGARVGTGFPGDENNPCTLDSAELSATQVPGQPEGTTMHDLSDYKDECPITWGGLPSLNGRR
jgi:hypothetical protein